MRSPSQAIITRKQVYPILILLFLLLNSFLSMCVSTIKQLMEECWRLLLLGGESSLKRKSPLLGKTMHPGAWTEVRRKKKPTSTGKETTYYITNIPNGSRLAEIRSPFTKYDQLVDVFITPKKNRNGKHFAFVRFAGVIDGKKLEEALQGIKCL